MHMQGESDGTGVVVFNDFSLFIDFLIQVTNCFQDITLNLYLCCVAVPLSHQTSLSDDGDCRADCYGHVTV